MKALEVYSIVFMIYFPIIQSPKGNYDTLFTAPSLAVDTLVFRDYLTSPSPAHPALLQAQHLPAGPGGHSWAGGTAPHHPPQDSLLGEYLLCWNNVSVFPFSNIDFFQLFTMLECKNTAVCGAIPELHIRRHLLPPSLNGSDSAHFKGATLKILGFNKHIFTHL